LCVWKTLVEMPAAPLRAVPRVPVHLVIAVAGAMAEGVASLQMNAVGHLMLVRMVCRSLRPLVGGGVGPRCALRWGTRPQ
jgi:hypothetical protein